MPLPGDQHRDTHATTNPFVEQKPHITAYTAQEIATLQSRLDKQLGPEFISTRPGAGGGKVHYLAADKVINLANEVFGFNGWSSSIQNVQIDFVDENSQNGKITLGLSTIVRITLRDGTFHEDIGYGHIENCKGKAAAFEKAKKEASTDAMKRALRTFGNVLGNCLYDKDYLQKVTKLKIAPSKWSAENLHRHPDYAPIKQESIADADARQDHNTAPARQPSAQSGASFGTVDFEDDFGGNPFDESDFTHPDEVTLDGPTNDTETPIKRAISGPQQNGEQPRQAVARTHPMPQARHPNIQSSSPAQNPQPPQRPQGPPRSGNAMQAHHNRMPPPQAPNNAPRPGQSAAAPMQMHVEGPKLTAQSAATAESPLGNPQHQQQRQAGGAQQHDSNGEEFDDDGFPIARPVPPGVPDGFVTGRNAELIKQPPGARPPNTALAFNPHADSPSIRRTQGMNPGKSAPVMRQALTSGGTSHAPPAGAHPQPPGPGNGMNGSTTPIRTNYVAPSADPNRRIGMPAPAAPHPMQNRNSYRPPTATKRPPLGDISNMQQMDGTNDAKKAKVDSAAAGPEQEEGPNEPVAS